MSFEDLGIPRPQEHLYLYSFGPYEIRRVPLDWQHPTDHTLPDGFIALQAREGYTPEEIAELTGDGIFEFMPDFSDVPDDKLGICLYETISDGIPTTPVFPNTNDGKLELMKFAAENVEPTIAGQTTVEGWAAILFGNGFINIGSGEVSTKFSSAIDDLEN